MIGLIIFAFFVGVFVGFMITALIVAGRGNWNEEEEREAASRSYERGLM